MARQSGKVRGIALPKAKPTTDPAGRKRHAAFQQYVQAEEPPEIGQVVPVGLLQLVAGDFLDGAAVELKAD